MVDEIVSIGLGRHFLTPPSSMQIKNVFQTRHLFCLFQINKFVESQQIVSIFSGGSGNDSKAMPNKFMAQLSIFLLEHLVRGMIVIYGSSPYWLLSFVRHLAMCSHYLRHSNVTPCERLSLIKFNECQFGNNKRVLEPKKLWRCGRIRKL